MELINSKNVVHIEREIVIMEKIALQLVIPRSIKHKIQKRKKEEKKTVAYQEDILA